MLRPWQDLGFLRANVCLGASDAFIFFFSSLHSQVLASPSNGPPPPPPQGATTVPRLKRCCRGKEHARLSELQSDPFKGWVFPPPVCSTSVVRSAELETPAGNVLKRVLKLASQPWSPDSHAGCVPDKVPKGVPKSSRAGLSKKLGACDNVCLRLEGCGYTPSKQHREAACVCVCVTMPTPVYVRTFHVSAGLSGAACCWSGRGPQQNYPQSEGSCRILLFMS